MNKKALIITYIILVLIVLILGYPIGQAYVPDYNNANELYKNGDYEGAIELYQNALYYFMPESKECSVRINLALAMCKTVQVDEQDQQSIKLAIEIYQSAIGVLEEKDCVSHNEDARQLRDDIQAEIDRLKNLQQSESSDDEKEEEKKQEKEKQQQTDSVEEKIKQIKVDATKTQREIERQFFDYNKDINMYEKNW